VAVPGFVWHTSQRTLVAVTVDIFPGIRVDEANLVWSDADHAAILGFAFPCSKHSRYVAYRVGLGTRELAQGMKIESIDTSSKPMSNQLVM
jgi:hypothetical protein